MLLYISWRWTMQLNFSCFSDNSAQCVTVVLDWDSSVEENSNSSSSLDQNQSLWIYSSWWVRVIQKQSHMSCRRKSAAVVSQPRLRSSPSSGLVKGLTLPIQYISQIMLLPLILNLMSPCVLFLVEPDVFSWQDTPNVPGSSCTVDIPHRFAFDGKVQEQKLSLH